jgi:ABC-type transport system involved in multi-copper enzyme maturation permease subunit
MAVSNSLVGALNFLAFLLSLPIIGAGIWLAKQHNSDCYRFLQAPIIALGAFILLLSLAGFVGSCFRVSCLLWVYLIVMFLLILLLFVFTVFAFVVTNKSAGEIVKDKGYKEYKLGDYSSWLRHQMNKTTNWHRIQSCLVEAKFCNYLRDKYTTEAELNDAKLTPVQVCVSWQ